MITPYTSFNSSRVSTIVPISLLTSCFLYLTHTSVFLPTVVLALLNYISDSPLYWDSSCFCLFVLFFDCLVGLMVCFVFCPASITSYAGNTTLTFFCRITCPIHVVWVGQPILYTPEVALVPRPSQFVYYIFPIMVIGPWMIL